ncbi:hypothetical protein BV898_06389 [Hypsibius exemplaris]|uniref:G-protein coupled receptors family 1 profile domain-containing protein n=1 Tax=Hypsibius exemplaris TaxID=2072580 RepID=A0A1W0WWR0_HYPEX|nr:hypothetical protein BV898_06389 [Hypsibius exemplaris]
MPDNTIIPLNNSSTIVPPGNLTFTNSTAVEPPWVVYKNAQLIWYVVSMIISAASAAANLLLVLVVATNRFLRTSSGLLIGHLAAMECLITTLGMPIHMTVTFIKQYNLSPDGCAGTQFFLAVTYTVSDWTLLFLALNRFVIIFFPHAHRTLSSKKALATGITMIWTLAICLNTPFTFDVSNRFMLAPPWYSCVLAPPLNDGYDFRVLHLMTAVYLPLAIVGSLYLAIVIQSAILFAAKRIAPVPDGRTVPSGGKNEEEQTRAAQAKKIKQKQRLVVIRVLFASWAVYCMCYFSNTIIANFNPTLISRSPVLQLWTRTAYVVGYIIHPLFLFCFSRGHLHGLKALLRRCRRQ